MQTIASRLRSLRKRDNKSQEIISEELGWNQSTWGNYERGVSSPDAERVEQLCIHFGISPNWLILGIGPMRLDGVDSASLPAEKPTPEIQIATLEARLRDKDATINVLTAAVKALHKEDKLELETNVLQYPDAASTSSNTLPQSSSIDSQSNK